MPESTNPQREKHTHRGKSSENHMDKNVILSHLPIQPGQMILDAGCGNGYMTKEFARLTGVTGKVYALDPDTESIEILQAETEGTGIEAFEGDITKETKLPASSIDLIYISTVIHGFSKTGMEGLITEVNRLLKPGGRLAIVEIKKQNTPFGPPMEIRFSPEELQQTINLNPTGLYDINENFYMQLFTK